jgi:N-methylhydantoinase B/oxoprolinase/acetone carboxylase alpha subunit
MAVSNAEAQKAFRDRRNAAAKAATQLSDLVADLTAQVAAKEDELARLQREADRTKVALALERLALQALRDEINQERIRRWNDLREEQAARDPEFEAALDQFIVRRGRAKAALAKKADKAKVVPWKPDPVTGQPIRFPDERPTKQR